MNAAVHGDARIHEVVTPRNRHRETLQRDLGRERTVVSLLHQLAHANRAHVAEHQLCVAGRRDYGDADIRQVGPDLLPM
jgi:hypothetical protein